MTMQEVKIYGKTELAEKYGVSRATLMSWFYKTFTESELAELCYNKNQKIFTKKQLGLIFLKIGKP